MIPIELILLGLMYAMPIAILTVAIGEAYERIKKLEDTNKQSDDEVLNKW